MERKLACLTQKAEYHGFDQSEAHEGHQPTEGDVEADQRPIGMSDEMHGSPECVGAIPDTNPTDSGNCARYTESNSRRITARCAMRGRPVTF